jgi:hypothetical protein
LFHWDNLSSNWSAAKQKRAAMCPVPVAQLNGTCRGNPILTLKFNITQPYLIQPKTAAIGNFLPDHFRSVCPCSRFVLFVVQLRRERERGIITEEREEV